MEEAERIFQSAKDLPVHKRDAFLRRACGSNEALSNYVARLLADAPGADDFFSDLVSHRLESGESAGSWVGAFLLLEQIGEGGCGTVFLAKQEVPLSREVALKVIKPGMGSSEIIARFEAERQTLALMEHPSIAGIYDAGTTTSGQPYFVMELVEGEPITAYCDDNCLSTHQRVDLFTKACAAVQHAHQKGIIHRDLKPSNILVTEIDGVPVPKIIDFGIAKATDQRLSEGTLLTQDGQLLGTPAYMSPEQAD